MNSRHACVLMAGTVVALSGGCASKHDRRPAPEPVQPAHAPGTAPTPPTPAPAAPPSHEPSRPQPTAVAAEPAEPAASAKPAVALREVFPFVRVDAQAKVVEFDGIVPLDAHDPHTPLVYLELVACTPDTREHESLVMTKADAAHIHAALLLIGLEPGKPGSWTWDGTRVNSVPPSGPELDVLLVTKDANGKEVVATPQSWIISARDAKRFDADGKGAWLFAGSMTRVRQGRERYEAQGAGTLIGLTTFGSETIAWRDVISPEASVEEPQWITDKAVVPPMGTPVTVRIRPR